MTAVSSACFKYFRIPRLRITYIRSYSLHFCGVGGQEPRMTTSGTLRGSWKTVTDNSGPWLLSWRSVKVSLLCWQQLLQWSLGEFQTLYLSYNYATATPDPLPHFCPVHLIYYRNLCLTFFMFVVVNFPGLFRSFEFVFFWKGTQKNKFFTQIFRSRLRIDVFQNKEPLNRRHVKKTHPPPK